jgi:hypothetical protein
MVDNAQEWRVLLAFESPAPAQLLHPLFLQNKQLILKFKTNFRRLIPNIKPA